MRNGYIGLASTLAFAAVAASSGCGTDTGGGASGGASAKGGAASTGGSAQGGANTGSGGANNAGAVSANGGASNTGTGGGNAGGSTSCPNVSPCGGSVVGTWNVTSSCVTLSGNMDVSLASLGCATVPATGSLQTTGTYTAKADGTYTDNTTTKGSVTFPLAASCLSISSVPVSCEKAGSIFTALGWTTAACSETNGKCSCTLSAEQQGGAGIVSARAATRGGYTTSGNNLTTDDGIVYSYCASGSTLTLTPQAMGLSGTVAFQKQDSSSGAGGSSAGGNGAGGAQSGGATGSGGANSGGKVGAGGTSAGGSAGQGGAPSTGGSANGGSGGGGTITGPCDIYAQGKTTCIAAHSTIRALFGSYSGNLYQVKRASDGTTKDIPVSSPGGFADSTQQDAFCMGTTCTIIKLYDQSGHGNFLEAETPGSTVGGHQGQTAASATAEMLMVSGHKVYSLYTKPSQAYWRDGHASGVPTGSAPQGIYIVTSGKHYNAGCCYDYGNGETSRTYVPGASMDALYFGNSTTWGSGNGSGPWVMADLEGGLFAQGSGGKNNNLTSQTATYVTAVEKNNGTTEMQLKAGDATTGNLNTYYKGSLPPGKNPMQKQGAIVLGSGGDCCYSNNNASQGTFYEGAIVAGYPSDTTDAAVQANVVSVSYGK
jgi:hypothetical protein